MNTEQPSVPSPPLRTDADTLQSLYNQIHSVQQNDGTLQWNDVAHHLGLGLPPNLPAGATAHFKVEAVHWFHADHRLLVNLNTDVGKSTLLIWRGSFGDPAVTTAPGWHFFFGYTLVNNIQFTELPVVGNLSSGWFGLRGLRALVTSYTLSKVESDGIYETIVGKGRSHELGATDYTIYPVPLPVTDDEENPPSGNAAREFHVELSVDISIAGGDIPLRGELDYPRSGGPQSRPEPTSIEKSKYNFTLHQAFVEFDHDTGFLWLRFDCSAAIGPLSGSLMNFGLGVRLDAQRDPHFAPSLKGIEFTLDRRPSLEVAGGLYVDQVDENFHDFDLDMWGELIVHVAKEFNAGFMGGYASTREAPHQPSLFGYGFLGIPVPLIPEVLTLTGFAGGLGVNRGLTIPKISDVDKFPLVRAAMSFAPSFDGTVSPSNPFPSDTSDPRSAMNCLEQMRQDIPIQAGEYWAALGVAFNVAEAFQGFALLTGAFGKELAFALLGEVKASFPPKVPKEEQRAYFEMYVRYDYEVSRKYFAGDSYLRHNSFMFSRACHLTGGIAVRYWGKDDPTKQIKSGEFVVSAGGYHPGFQKPSYYPAVSRLAMDWPVDEYLQFKGEAYFAVTRAVIMAGFALDMNLQVRSWIRVWATSELDFLLQYHPFFYDVFASVHFGLTVRIKVWFVHVNLTFHVGVDLHAWGPEFSGTARFDVSVVSFRLHLGGDAHVQQTISYSEFEDKYLPHVQNTLGEPTDPQPYVVSKINAVAGVARNIYVEHDDDPKWIVDPEHLVLKTHSAIPIKTATGTNLCTLGTLPTHNVDFGVGPCGFSASQLTSSHAIDLTGPGTQHFTATPLFGNASAALWDPDAKNHPMGADTLIDHVLTGFELRPDARPLPDRLPAASRANLMAPENTFHLDSLEPYRDYGLTPTGTTVQNSIESPQAQHNRSQWLTAVNHLLLSAERPGTTADVHGFSQNPDDQWFTSGPSLSFLGQI